MPSVKQLRKSLVAHNKKCKVKGVRKMKKAQLITANRMLYGKKRRITTHPRPSKGPKRKRKSRWDTTSRGRRTLNPNL